MPTEPVIPDLAIFEKLKDSLELETNTEPKQGERRYAATKKILREAINYSRQHKKLSIPNTAYYLFADTELTHRLMIAIDVPDFVFRSKVLFALKAIALEKPMTDIEKLDALSQFCANKGVE